MFRYKLQITGACDMTITIVTNFNLIRFVYTLICLLLMLFTCGAALSAGETVFQGIEETILTAEDELRKEVYSKNAKIDDSNRFINLVMAKECSHHDLNRLNQELNNEKSLIEKNDPGIKFEAGFRVKSDDIDGNSHSGFAGLAWNLLNNGLLENRSRARRFSYESTIDSLRAEMDSRQEVYHCREAFIRRYFDYLKHDLLERRLRILNTCYGQIRELYFSGKVGADDLLNVELDVNRVKLLIENYELQKGGVDFTEEFKQYPLPDLFTLDFTKMIRPSEESKANNQIETLSEAVLAEKYHRLTDKTLRLYARTGISNEDNEETSNNVTVGVYFSTPINRKTRDLYPVELRRAKYRLQKEKDNAGRELERLRTGYTEKLADAVKLFYDIRITGERLRKAVIELEKSIRTHGSFTVKQNLLVYRLLQSLLKSRFDYLSAQENLYRRIVYMVSLSGASWDDASVIQAKTSVELIRGRRGDRGIYIWSRDFNHYENKFLIRVFVAKGVSTVIISASEKTDVNKLQRFIAKAASYNISTELMISENTWVLPEKWDRVENKLTRLLSYTSSVHLDIEPHVLDDYKLNRKKYTTYFLSMVEKTSALLKGKANLTISLPVSHTPDFVEKVSEYADRIYIMAYGTRNVETMGRRLKSFKRVPPDKVVLALRPDDFSTELQLEHFIDRLTEMYGITAFAFHDLGQFFHLSGTLKHLKRSGELNP